MNSETPETDQQAHWTTFEDGFWGVERCSAETGTWVPIDFARRLELRCKRLEEALRAIHIRTFGGASLRFNHKQIEEVCRKALADQKEEKS